MHPDAEERVLILPLMMFLLRYHQLNERIKLTPSVLLTKLQICREAWKVSLCNAKKRYLRCFPCPDLLKRLETVC